MKQKKEKKPKLKLSQLSVNSFVTGMDKDIVTVQGGRRGSFIVCESVNVCSVDPRCQSAVSKCLCPDSYTCPPPPGGGGTGGGTGDNTGYYTVACTPNSDLCYTKDPY